MSHHENHSCIVACTECAQACEHCATACLGESHVEAMARCIRLDIDCATLCWAAAGYMSRGSEFIHQVCDLCAEMCEACAEECGKHEHDHCQECAEACRRCARECRKMAHASA